ncbi:hypothetical protein EJ110_NYTH51389 [Nymphaea thermarum]|nr:hypothetical protein EJ110_NYTH51389 [Nymphaea thermarum]
MADSSSSSVNTNLPDVASARTDHVPVQVTTIQLTKENYSRWSPAITMGIVGRGRIAYVNGRKVEPAADSMAWDTWFLEDNQVKTWIVNSVSPDIQPLILRKKTARDVDHFGADVWSKEKESSCVSTYEGCILPTTRCSLSCKLLCSTEIEVGTEGCARRKQRAALGGSRGRGGASVGSRAAEAERAMKLVTLVAAAATFSGDAARRYTVGRNSLRRGPLELYSGKQGRNRVAGNRVARTPTASREALERSPELQQRRERRWKSCLNTNGVGR